VNPPVAPGLDATARAAQPAGLPLDEPAAAAAKVTAVPVAPTRALESITLPIGTSLAQAERLLTLATLRHYKHHKERTAATLGISLKTLYNRLKEYAAEVEDPSAAALKD
jgi:DNA-binding NtrC family response regulator